MKTVTLFFLRIIRSASLKPLFENVSRSDHLVVSSRCAFWNNWFSVYPMKKLDGRTAGGLTKSMARCNVLDDSMQPLKGLLGDILTNSNMLMLFG